MSRVAIVTGASRGIGLATAAQLLAEDYRVVITARNQEALDEAAASLGADDRVLAIAGNSGDAEHRRDAVARTIERFGSLDVLVNNTGINPAAGNLAKQDLDGLRKIFDVNVVGTLGWVQEASGQWMWKNGGGAIVNVSSVSGIRPQRYIGGYGASKAALIHMTEQLARELGPKIRVNAVAPAIVRTKFGAPLFEQDEDAAAAAYPLKRIGEPEDVAQAIAFLASEERAGWISGQTIVLDGGLLTVSGTEA